MNDVTKLPKWAQQELKTKDAMIAHLQKTIDDMVGSDGSEADIVYDMGMYPDKGKPLPKHTTVRFKTGDRTHEAIEVRLARDSSNQTYVHIYSTERLTIRPNSANIIYAYTER